AHLDASYEIGGYAYNFGSNDATGVTGNADFGTFAYSYSLGTVVSGDTAIYGAPETPTLEVGLYEGTFGVTSNEEVGTEPTIANNKSLRNFEVTEKLYSLDGIGVYNENLLALTSLGSNSFNTPTGTVFASMYHLRAGDNTINGVEIALASGSTANTEIQVAIIDTAEFLADGIMPVTDANGVEALSGFYSISSSDLTNGTAYVSFQSPIVLPDNAYFVAVLTTVDQSQIIRILDDQTVVQPWYASMIHLINDGGTYSNGNALGIRLKTQTVGLEESVGINLNVFPNPAQDVLTIASNVNSGSIVISDVSGKIVQVVTMQSSTSTLSTAGLENGIYYVTISNDNFSKTEKVLISK
ncbi:MAG: T9SS type A sorting domain-containing protein, partial [Crocinitomicaceae bacterium]